jgi:tripartite-type tricarboxylate transporter receptor subunit TctC
VLALATLVATAAHAQSFPSKPIRVVVPFAAGTSPDIAMRLLSPGLAERLGQPVLVENRAGAAGSIGAAQVAQAAPDGYTLLYTVNSVLCANPHLYAKLPFDPLKSFAPVSMAANLGYVLLGRHDLPAKTLPELIALAKSQPGKLTYGSSGDGSGPHIVMELISGIAGLSMLHVPMRANATTATLAGEVDLTLSPYTTGVPAAKSGKFRVYGVTLAKRAPPIPEVPAIAETLPGLVGDGWHGIFAAGGTPPAVVERLNAEIGRVLALPDIRQKLADLSLEPFPTSPAETAAILQRDHAKWGKVIRDANIKIQ